MIRRELIKAQDQIEGGGEVRGFVAEIGVHTAVQQRWQRSRFLTVQQQWEHAFLLRFGAEKTVGDQIDLGRHDVAGTGVLVLVLPAVERCADHDDPVALLDPLDEPRHARANLRVVPPVQHHADPRLLQIRRQPFLDPAFVLRHAPGIADEALRRLDLLLGHVGLHPEDGLLEARPLFGGAALQLRPRPATARVNWIGSAIFGNVSFSPHSLQKAKSVPPSSAGARPIRSSMGAPHC